ncbi:DUF1850 domain-containing protein [Marinobacter salicampi]|uniref:DUF1850 domain-containing protein n=1 Tax=Marinobacter salicampi TaxID=435907 RepID=UPI00140E79FA|nr:DUF1850 domain-containing protein [Marinobacter salicampi]
MSLCVLVAGKTATCLAGALFSLSWTHSVEKTQWIEHWGIQNQQLSLQKTFVKGSGAGVDPAPHARLVDGWYEWAPRDALTVPFLSLANSRTTPDNWRLCRLDPDTLEPGKCVDFSALEDEALAGFTLKPQ